MTNKTYKERLQAWERGKFAPPPEPDLTPSPPTIIEMVPMRDGVHLYTEVYLPPLEDKKNGVPVILIRSPYPFARASRNDWRPISRYMDEGYALVFQLTRGQYKSEGAFRFHLDDMEDSYDTIHWITVQEWCDGNIGMEGASYAGRVQLQAARTKPEALKCIMPTAHVGNFISCFPMMGGIPARGWWLQWHKIADAESMADLDTVYGDMNLLKHPVWGPAYRKRPLIAAADGLLTDDKLTSWHETISHHSDEDYWKPAHLTDEELAELDLPIFFTGGWLDLTVGVTDDYQRLKKSQPDREDCYLLMGPWDHYQTYAGQQESDFHGDREIPTNGMIDLLALRIAFYNRHLKGRVEDRIQKDHVRVFITGADVWRDFPTFPAPDTEQRKLFLHSGGDARSFPGDGLLNWDTPEDEPSDSYVYDPELATPAPIEFTEFYDRRELEIRSDVLTYTSKPFSEPLTILGDIKLSLHAATDCRDTDWFARLTEVFSDGRSIAFHGAIPALRARYRKGFDKESLLTPNEPTEYSISLGPAGHQIAAGNRLRLSIYSASFPACDPNTNTGNPVVTDTESRVARQTVFHDMARPSCITIPVIDIKP